MKKLFKVLLVVLLFLGVTGCNPVVNERLEARDYARPGSFKCTNHRDLYLYSRTTTSLRPKDTSSNGGSSRGGSSTHTSSSGRSHGGGGRRL